MRVAVYHHRPGVLRSTVERKGDYFCLSDNAGRLGVLSRPMLEGALYTMDKVVFFARGTVLVEIVRHTHLSPGDHVLHDDKLSLVTIRPGAEVWSQRHQHYHIRLMTLDHLEECFIACERALTRGLLERFNGFWVRRLAREIERRRCASVSAI